MDWSETNQSFKDKAMMDNRDLDGGGRGNDSASVDLDADDERERIWRCTTDLTEAKMYHRSHMVCEAHAKAATIIVARLRQQFCQQCSRNSVDFIWIVIRNYASQRIPKNHKKRAEKDEKCQGRESDVQAPDRSSGNHAPDLGAQALDPSRRQDGQRSGATSLATRC